ncbi:MAG: AraC family transcriptional regulator [Neglectibacter timonensis]
MSLSEIAGKLSYCHTNSFMRVFKSVVGMTPGEYRRLFSTRMEGHR